MQNLRKTNETGRSMVEMLGVLAIVGTLSVGGVYGYGVAMKKHKANELLHQASMLATTVSAQIETDKPLNVQDFGNSKYGTFDTPEKVNDEQFKMQITDMDSAVCEQMEKMSGGMVRQAKCNGTTLTLTYNNNLSSDKVAADYNDDTTGGKCEDAGYKQCGNSCKKDCCSGVTLNSCQESCDSTTGEIINKDDGTGCTISDGTEGTCSDGECKLDYSGVECTEYENNTECGGVGSGWYCAFSPSPELYDGCKTDVDRGDGICKEATGTKISGYWVSNDSMYWWDAHSWCVAQGAYKLITEEKIREKYSGEDDIDWGKLRNDGFNGGFWLNNSKGNCQSGYIRVLIDDDESWISSIKRSFDYYQAWCEG